MDLVTVAVHGHVPVSVSHRLQDGHMPSESGECQQASVNNDSLWTNKLFEAHNAPQLAFFCQKLFRDERDQQIVIKTAPVLVGLRLPVSQSESGIVE